jgi:hypothetical protein
LYLNSIIESIYKTGEGKTQRALDGHLSPAAYAQCLGDGLLKAHSVRAITKLLREVTFWDSHAAYQRVRAVERTKEEEVFITAIHANAYDSEPATVIAFGWVAQGTSEYLLTESCKRTGLNYLNPVAAFVEAKSEEMKRRQKNQSKGIKEQDGMRWDFSAVKKTLDATKLALRSVQHVRDEDLWAEKGEQYLADKLRHVFAGLQDLIGQTEVRSFTSGVGVGGGEDGRSGSCSCSSPSMCGSYPSDLAEIATRPSMPKVAKETLQVFSTQLSNIA